MRYTVAAAIANALLTTPTGLPRAHNVATTQSQLHIVAVIPCYQQLHFSRYVST